MGGSLAFCWGLIAWCAAGLLLGLVARLLPPWRGASWLLTLTIGLLGATSGGVLATALGFGGLVGFDVRACAAAALGALLALLLFALSRVPART